MAQEVQAECHRYENEEVQKSNNSCIDVAFAPSIIEIGFIDEEADEGDVTTSDVSETSISEDDKLEKVQTEVTIAPSNGDEDLLSLRQNGSPNNFETENNETVSSILHNHFQSEDVPSQQITQAKHSNKKSTSVEPSANHQENGLQCLPSTSTEEESQSDGDLKKEKEHEVQNDQPKTLEESMFTLRTSFENKSELGTFEKLSKRREDITMDVAKLSENTPKNRYKDVLPYGQFEWDDDSRVILQECKSGDYINASFVSMEIPPLQKTNQYIATQGPLPHTCEEFWQMVWEQKCNIIVMVTTLKERNRVKCHQYWPDLNETITYGDIQISCFEETESPAGITRDMLLINEEIIARKVTSHWNNMEKDEQRHVIQMQHVTWPDHGVPEDATDFINFIQQLRELRSIVGGKVVVHCSAGVGRTGVLILMETAMCLIETGNPVIPLDLVKIMREQRVMMVQTVGQYKFICEAVLKLYNDHQKKMSSQQKSPPKL